MYIGKCVGSSISLNNSRNKKNNPNFLSSKIFGYKAYKIEKELADIGINSEFQNNSFVAECVQKTAALFNNLFGRDSLPKEAFFTSFLKKFDENENTLGMHIHYKYSPNDEVYFNSDNNCYKTKNKLKFNEMTEKFLWWHPTGHYLQTFVHEFGHSAHFHHLCNKNNQEVMSELHYTKIPTALGRFISKFKLGRYSATNMNEFMAERITKDICTHLDKNDHYTGFYSDLDYANIFSNKWKYRYSSPQSYLDYYTQQVWNGDKEGANETLDDMGRYLKKIEAEEALPVLQKVEEEVEEESLLGCLAHGLLNLNKKITQILDRRNDLDLLKRY